MPLLPFLLGVLLVATPAAPAHRGLHEKIAAVQAELAEDPDDPLLYLKRSELYRLHGDWDAALADVESVQALLDDGATVAGAFTARYELHKARLFSSAEWWCAARVVLDRILAQRPEHAEAALLRARVHRAQAHPAAALADYDRAVLHTERADAELYVERAQFTRSLGAEHEERALRGLDEGLSRLGTVPALQLMAIEIELSRDRFDAALARVATIAERSQRQERWLAMRGDILCTAARLEEARAAYVQTLAAIRSIPVGRRSQSVADLERHVSGQLAKLPSEKASR